MTTSWILNTYGICTTGAEEKRTSRILPGDHDWSGGWTDSETRRTVYDADRLSAPFVKDAMVESTGMARYEDGKPRGGPVLTGRNTRSVTPSPLPQRERCR